MTDQWTDRLSEYLDGELEAAERSALEGHLPACAACTRTLRELRAVADRARGLGARAPASDLWPGIAARIRTGRAAGGRRRAVRRRVWLTRPQLAAAGIAVLIVGVAMGRLLWRAEPGPESPGGIVAAPPAGGVADVMPASDLGGPAYDAAVAELEMVLRDYRDALDTTTVRVLDESLRAIDGAIADARRALAADSANAYVGAHLAQTLRRKLELLRRAAALVTAAS